MNNTTSSQSMQPGWLLMFAAWILATSGLLTTLFFSEVVKVPICVLCWYQRIAMYPLVLLLPLALFPFDARMNRYAGALVGFGWLTALYHVLLVAGFIPESAQPCVAGIPCFTDLRGLVWFFNHPDDVAAQFQCYWSVTVFFPPSLNPEFP